MRWYKRMASMSFEVSQLRRSVEDDDNDAAVEDAVLAVEKFAAVPWVRYGHVVVGGRAVGAIQFVNNSDSEEVIVVDKIGHCLQMDQKTYRVPPHSSSVTAQVTWTPDQLGGFRESIHFKVSSRLRLKVIAYGVGVEKRKTTKKVMTQK